MTLVAILTVPRDAEPQYRAYEAKAERIMARHGGAIERVIEVEAETPDTFREVHIVRFPDDAAFAAYRADPEIVASAPERSAAILQTQILRAKH
ncbi:MAG: DUF1330 domain-containing protein [Bryobacteraceae bacterium]